MTKLEAMLLKLIADIPPLNVYNGHDPRMIEVSPQFKPDLLRVPAISVQLEALFTLINAINAVNMTDEED